MFFVHFGDLFKILYTNISQVRLDSEEEHELQKDGEETSSNK